jgi:hypothetical protein
LWTKKNRAVFDEEGNPMKWKIGRLTKEIGKKHCEAAINRSKWWKIVARERWHLTMRFSKSTPLQL